VPGRVSCREVALTRGSNAGPGMHDRSSVVDQPAPGGLVGDAAPSGAVPCVRRRTKEIAIPTNRKLEGNPVVPGQRASIQDVACLAGVSVATVSRTLSGARAVRPEMRAVVEKAAKALDYRPHAVAQALRRKTTSAIGLVVPQVMNPFFPVLVHAVEQVLQGFGFALLLCNSDDDPKLEALRVGMLVDRQVDGLLISCCHRRKSAAAISNIGSRVAVVQLDRCADGASLPFVGVDDSAAVHDLVALGEQEGRTRLAYIGGDESSWSGHQRAKSFRKWAGALDPASKQRMMLGSFSGRWGFTSAQELLARGPSPDMMLCGSDTVALGAMEACLDAQVAVPEMLAISGFDDVDLTRVVKPSITTVRQPVTEMVEVAAKLLMDRIGGAPPSDERVLLPAKIVRRESLGRAPGEGPSGLDG
jgi:LacI family transcriptional regulator